MFQKAVPTQDVTNPVSQNVPFLLEVLNGFAEEKIGSTLPEFEPRIIQPEA
jgi:hypothetical protein